MPNFWNHLTAPLHCLAPMEEVTDTAFREVVASTAAPGRLGAMFTEFVSTDGLCHPVGREKVAHRLFISDAERLLLKQKNIRIVAQIWGSRPEKFAQALREVEAFRGFDGIDINMGCPVPKIVKQGGCSALIRSPSLAKEIVLACKEAIDLPISVKTRTGINQHDTEKWIPEILSVRPAALILHGRTQKQQSDGLACWNQIGLAARLRDEVAPGTPVIGNGDVRSIAEADAKCSEHGLQGVMIGRGIFHDPWLFRPEQPPADAAERLALLWFHTRRFHDNWGAEKNFQVLRRFYKIYATGFPDAAVLRNQLMEARDLDHVRELLINFGFPPD